MISRFEDALEKMVALAVLMPIVASMGGNAGTQTMTVAVRALATRELDRANAWRVIRRELLVGALNGLGFAVIMGTIAYAWFDIPGLGIVIALAMVTVLIAAALGVFSFRSSSTGSASTLLSRPGRSSRPSRMSLVFLRFSGSPRSGCHSGSRMQTLSRSRIG